MDKIKNMELDSIRPEENKIRGKHVTNASVMVCPFCIYLCAIINKIMKKSIRMTEKVEPLRFWRKNSNPGVSAAL